MLRNLDIVKAFIAALAVSTALGACSGGATVTPQIAQTTMISPSKRADAVEGAVACTPVFPCSRVTIVRALSATVNEANQIVLADSTGATPWHVTSLGEFHFASGLVQSQNACLDICSLIVSSAPLADGVATPSIVFPRLAGLRSDVSLPSFQATFPAGNYYFYLATIPT